MRLSNQGVFLIEYFAQHAVLPLIRLVDCGRKLSAG